MKPDPVLLGCAFVALIIEFLISALPWVGVALVFMYILWLWCRWTK